MAERTGIRYAELSEAVKQSLPEMQSLPLTWFWNGYLCFPFSYARLFSLHCSLLRTAKCYLTKRGWTKRPSTRPCTSYYGPLFPKSLLWVWEQATLVVPPSYPSNWCVPKPSCPLPNGACLCTEGLIQSRGVPAKHLQITLLRLFGKVNIVAMEMKAAVPVAMLLVLGQHRTWSTALTLWIP